MIDELFIRAFKAHQQQGGVFHRDSDRAHEVFQMSTISALSQGLYDGEITYAQLAQHGDFGLGTFNGLDGEMVAFDGKFYQIKSDGKVYPVDGSLKAPFAVVMFFDPTVKFSSDDETDFKAFQHAIDGAVPSKNLFYAVKCEGDFKLIKVRTVPRQKKPYPPEVEVAKTQVVSVCRNVRGTMVGFRFPDYTKGINVSGYHLHFLNQSFSAGGHVFDFVVSEVRIEIDVVSNLHMAVPESGEFLTADLSKDQTEAIRKVEKNKDS
ncbi:acetolactate decarboxylase [Desulfobacterota bacterium AH_259_B03_O07]|nr:acetolactate decarboxylase [Desulfobacterota bacterium AH_259_B03_O07]